MFFWNAPCTPVVYKYRLYFAGDKLVTFNNHWGHLLWLGTDYEPVLSELKKQIN